MHLLATNRNVSYPLLVVSCLLFGTFWGSTSRRKASEFGGQKEPANFQTFLLVHASRDVISTVVKNSSKFTKGNPFPAKGGGFMFGFRYFIVSGLQRSELKLNFIIKMTQGKPSIIRRDSRTWNRNVIAEIIFCQGRKIFCVFSLFMEPEKASTRMKTTKSKILMSFKDLFCNKNRQTLKSVLNLKIWKFEFEIWISNLTNQMIVFSAFIQSGYRGTRLHFSI